MKVALVIRELRRDLKCSEDEIVKRVKKLIQNIADLEELIKEERKREIKIRSVKEVLGN